MIFATAPNRARSASPALGRYAARALGNIRAKRDGTRLASTITS